MRYSNMGYEPTPRPFLRIQLGHALFRAAATTFLNKISIGDGRGVYGASKTELDFLIASKDVYSFVAIDSSVFETTNEGHQVDYARVRRVEAPMFIKPVVMSLDIETISGDYSKDHIKYTEDDMIGMISTRVGLNNRVAFVVGRPFTKPIPGWSVRFFEDEYSMIYAFADHVTETNPDIIAGYNHERFDLPRIIKRARPVLGRGGEHAFTIPVVRQSNQMGIISTALNYCSGRIIMDAMVIMRKEMEKYRSYKLSAMAEHFELTVVKDPVEYEEIPFLYHGTDEERWRLVKYGCIDVDVLEELIEKRNMVGNLIAACQVSMTRANDYMSRGEAFKFRRAIRDLAGEEYLVLDAPKVSVTSLQDG
jgi:DNA polymerase elongation subunit (family B)